MTLAVAQSRGAGRRIRVDDTIEELTLKLDYVNAKIDALQTIVALLLGWEDKRNAVVLSSLRKLAAGDVPELVPDLSTVPSNSPRLSGRTLRRIWRSMGKRRKSPSWSSRPPIRCLLEDLSAGKRPVVYSTQQETAPSRLRPLVPRSLDYPESPPQLSAPTALDAVPG